METHQASGIVDSPPSSPVRIPIKSDLDAGVGVPTRGVRVPTGSNMISIGVSGSPAPPLSTSARSLEAFTARLGRSKEELAKAAQGMEVLNQSLTDTQKEADEAKVDRERMQYALDMEKLRSLCRKEERDIANERIVEMEKEVQSLRGCWNQWSGWRGRLKFYLFSSNK
ncbi:hypothetical protein Dsin_016226 [Dipteronia sinensis]|uniref:Uncharacterized protein n=1 Tax=Dipteronia sinensis TaxID=43782 RepID=A0AAE0E5S6_9ROSI|nr:hypothetical protein Dsin_016226 [Dipteronia sinensis]